MNRSPSYNESNPFLIRKNRMLGHKKAKAVLDIMKKNTSNNERITVSGIIKLLNSRCNSFNMYGVLLKFTFENLIED